ncbi:MAG: 50S ribosomal protein L29 [Nitrospiraceae bacterium]|nr:MAG: 50S ribosomal protein L29 [Nitrospiraceae bacterium]RPH82213.1 MAG: 50S ribosomal protein L29 [Nitrospiraceae bacterium]
MDVKELRQLTGPELVEKAQQLTQELFNLRFQLGTGRLENPMQVRKTKRSIARVKTLQRELVQADSLSTSAKGI